MAQAKKRKRFFEVEIPILKKETQLQAYEPEEVEGKTIKYDLTRILKGKNVILYLKVKKQNEKFVAIPANIELIHSSLSRMVRRGTDYVEDSFLIDCKDYQLKIQIGKLVEVAKIYRDLMYIAQQKDLSFGERVVLQTTEELIAQEIQIIKKKEREAVVQVLRNPFKQFIFHDKSFLHEAQQGT